jgi:hypothetical protein
MRSALIIALLLAAPAAAQSVTSSGQPDRVAVTIYRAPGRSATTPMNRDWLGGLALITETRRIDVPAGEGEIRFEGVAGGIIPESAIVTGLPDGVIEKNQDAALLSPGSLLDRSLGRRVHLRRTSLATGRVTEQDAIIRSGAGGAVVLQTPGGFEALRCTGLKDALVYDEVPQGLSAKPTLSVRTRSAKPVTATVTLSYLATGFDWEANYVAKLRPDGRHVDLFAWLTLASQDETSLINADTKAVAGRVNAEDDREPRQQPKGEELRLRCWPAGTTHGGRRMFEGFPPPPAPPPPPMMAMAVAPVTIGAQDIVVTGTRVPTREDIGDFKLYSLPERVTVAAKSQKQVALLSQPAVGIELLYRVRVWRDSVREPQPQLVLRTINKPEWGLGLPLPAGTFALFDRYRGRPVLLGEGTTADRAIGEKAEVELGPASNVKVETDSEDKGRDRSLVTLTVTNDEPHPILFEAKITSGNEAIGGFSSKIYAEGKERVWRAEVPANSSRSLSYVLTDRD